MEQNILDKKIVKIHFTGILGVSMSSIAKHLSACGYLVSGSDNNANGDYKSLIDFGVNARFKHSAKKVKGADAVVFTSAINEKNPELKYAKRKNIPIFKRSEILGKIISHFQNSVAVSGSHGKTTATAMIADMLISAGKDPTVFLGGESVAFGNYRKGCGDFAITEACEYKKNFLDIKPKIAVVLNIDNDHQDSYLDMVDMEHAFNQFISSSIAVINADDNRASKLESAMAITFGIENKAIITAKNIKKTEQGYKFIVCAYGRALGEVKLEVIGKHNIYNALATVAVAEILKIPFSLVKKSLESFLGVKRRAEYIGQINNANCFADYAHHPKEITATITAYKEHVGDFAVVFQPHTYSRTKYLMQEFCYALKNKEDLVIYKTYAAREKFDEDGSESALYEQLKKCSSAKMHLCASEEELETIVQKLASAYKTILFLGAGDVYDKAKELVSKNKSENI
jgi:UDP-N-acetylmuramate--alanine ligase